MDNLRKLRKETGYTCESLGALVGVQKSAMSKYERGDIQPSQEVLKRLADILDTTTDYLLGISDMPTTPKIEKMKKEPTRRDRLVQEINAILDKVPESKLDKVKALLQVAIEIDTIS